ncbi:type I polyketide synthase [[Clostridium] polysaccharolyticum]|uniref:Thioester reductase domain-containing protein n=1 Tax=[Clostridium] polysaccharolyticum TaxID=29364 RepID=A0A1I0EWL4_9FIRM|nr:type I polyketide synthase [[Clostridium] polysaccharolyticum]SET49288.1 thioester reductase domain-containing protein [[Clostridium] polysaccharolyticum]
MQKIIGKIKTLIQDVSGIDEEEIEIDCNLFSLGLDSLMLVQIKKKIDKEFQVEIPMARVMSDLDTIEKIAQFIVENTAISVVSGSNEDDDVTEQLKETVELWKPQKKEISDEKITVQEGEKESVSRIVHSDGVQSILEMQMKVMADSLQNLAVKQLEALAGQPEEPVEKNMVKNRFSENATAKKKENRENTNRPFPQVNFRAVKLDRDIFTLEQKAFIQKFIKRYNEKTRKSKEYARNNREQFCDWIASLNFRTDFKELIYPIVSSHSQGSKFWDLDENLYLDMAIGYGVHYFGHRPQFIIDAIQQQIAKGYETGPQTDLGGEVSRLICKITGAQRAAFSNTGSEAVMAALRIARTVKKKPKIVMFKGAYHGNFDCVLAESLDGVTFPTSPGTMYGMVEDVMVLEYAKEESLRIIEEHGFEIAGVIVEPVQSRNPGLQPKEFLTKLRVLTERINAALIFDEMITGFRICPGGCQEYFGIKADMATYGKIAGGGLPIGIVAGKAEYLDAVDGGYWNYGDNSYPEKEMTFFAGTFCKHPLSLAASKAVLQFIDKDGGAIQRQVNEMTAQFVMSVNAYFREANVPLIVKYFGSEFRFEAYGKYDLAKLPAEIELFFYLLMEKGVYIWEKRTCFFSAAHTKEDACFFLQAIKESVEEMRKGGFSFSSEQNISSEPYKKKTGLPEPIEEPGENICKITKAQERYFLLSQMEKAEAGTHLPSAFVLSGDFDTSRVEEIFQKIVDSQEALRACYCFRNDEIVLKIQDKCKIQVEFEEGQEAYVNQYVKEFIRPFDVFCAPLMHVKVVKLAEKKYLMLSDLHHSIADGYSCTLITKLFMDLYEGKELETVGRACSEYVNYQEWYSYSSEHGKAIEFWKNELADKDYGVVFPLDYARTEGNNTSGACIHEIIGHQVLIGLKKLAKDMKCTLYHLLYGAFALLLYKTTKKEEFVVGTPIMTRDEVFAETIGYYTNTVVIKNRIEDSWQLEKYIEAAKLYCGQSIAYSKIAFADLIPLVEPHRKENRNPVFDTMFIYENAEERVNHMADIRCESVQIPVSQSFFDLSFEVIEEHKQLTVGVTYKTSLYKKETAERIVSWYVELLKEMIHHPEKTVSGYLKEYEKDWETLRQESQECEKKRNSVEIVLEGEKENSKIVCLQNIQSIEEELKNYWKDSLNLSEVDVQENFFDLGGRSIDAMKLIDRLRQRYAITIMDLFKYPTIEQLAKKIGGKAKAEEKKNICVSEKGVMLGKKENGQMPIAIIGMAGRFPKSRNVNEFWDNLIQGKECIEHFQKEELLEAGIPEEELEDKNYVYAKGILEDAEWFDATFFEYSPKEAEKMDPQIRIFHECVWNALEDAGYTPGSVEGGGEGSQNIGVFAGSASDYTWMTQIYQPTSCGQERIERISLNDKDYMTTRISYKMNLTGPSYGVQTACSSSLTSIHLACSALERGECEMALAGGVSVMLPKKTGYHYEEGMIFSKDGHCRVFDEQASGTIFSDGAGVLVLKPLEKAVEDKDTIYAVIRGTAANNDGKRKAGYTAPSIEGQKQVIEQALENANVDPSTVTYVEAHGTGTLLGDPIEVEGLKEVYPRKEQPYCALGSLKSNFGHLDAAAGVAGVIKAALALKNHKIPASINCETPNPNMHLEESPFYIPKQTVLWKKQIGKDGCEIPRRAGVTSLGFGGTNAHIILEEYEKPLESAEYKGEAKLQKLFLFSAKTSAALERMKKQYIEYLETNKKVNLEDVAYTLLIGRKAFSYRQMVLASTREELLEGLRGEKKHVLVKEDTVDKEKSKVVFLFTGQGSQYVNMARELYEKESLFQNHLDRCFAIMNQSFLDNRDYKNIVFPAREKENEASQKIRETGNAQVILFMIEYSMAMFLMELGIKPDALLGHSLGEYVAACVAGVFSLEQGLRLVAERAKLMQGMERGGMDALTLTEEDARKLIKESQQHLWVAAVNGEQNCVVSGSFEELGQFEKFLEQKSIDYKRLETSHAFHSGMMEPMLEDFAKLLNSISMEAPKIPYISNLTGTWITDEVITPEYWCEHLRHTVLFYEGIKTVLSKKCIFVEVGPGKVLSSLVKQCQHNGLQNIKSVQNMIRHSKEKIDDVTYLVGQVGGLWCSGVTINFDLHYKNYPLNKVSLPGYPFQGQEFPAASITMEKERESRSIEDWLYRPCWKMMKPATGSKESVSSMLVLAKDKTLFEQFYQKLTENGISFQAVLVDENWETRLQNLFADSVEMNQEVTIINAVPYSELTQESCFWEIVRQVQIFGSSKQIRYYTVSQERSGQEYLLASLINGVCSVANKEYENISCTHIQIAGESGKEQLVEYVLEECASLQSSAYIKYLNGVRLEASHEPLLMEESEASAFQKGGNYVITGGLGDIGRFLADYLIDKYDANLLLLGRNELPEENQWKRYLEEQPEDSTAQKIKSLFRWKEKGTQVTVKICDICNLEEVENEVLEFEHKHGEVNGVFHTAGIRGEGLIRFKTKEKSMEVLRPKVLGTKVLDQVFAKKKLDFMLLFSSLATVTEDAGQSDYVAANRYLDAYADWAAKKYYGRKTISVRWDNWKNIGMAHRACLEKNSISSFFQDGLMPGQGIRIIEKVLNCREPQVIVSIKELTKKLWQGERKDRQELIKNMLQGTVIYERPELSSEYAAPVTEIEKHLALVWAGAFSLKTVGIYDDFFELGGDSLYAIGIVNELKKSYQVDMTDIYDYPTVAQLALKLEPRSFDLKQQLARVSKTLAARKDSSIRERQLKEEQDKYEELCKAYDTMKLEKKKNWKQILLLGGTGYLGIYLLKEIVTQTDAQVVLIVRSHKDCDGQTRIYEKFCEYFGEEIYQIYQDRWLVLEGDITEQNFGLDYTVYWELAKITECIVNASGKVDHYGEYEAFYEANVETVKQIVAFSKTGCKKEIHQMSTKGVGTGKIEGRDSILFTEFDTDFGQEFNNYYVDTKHEAEQMLLGLRADGFDVNVYRIGDIVYDSENGHFQENIEKNAVYLLMQSILQLDYLPDLDLAFIEFSYVDFISKAVLKLMQQEELKQETYHLQNPHLLTLRDLSLVLKEEGFGIEYIEGKAFIQYLVENYDVDKKKNAIQNFLTYSHLLEVPMYTEFVIATKKTCCLLHKLGLNWNRPDVESLRKMIEYGQKIHFFSRPLEKEDENNNVKRRGKFRER